MKKIDLNCDMGESFGAYTIGLDEQAIGHISSANIACGFHAGDPRVLDRTVKMAAENKVGVGAHPGYPDLVGFGRRPMDGTLDELRTDIIYQVGAIRAFCDVHGVRLQHVKPHGAFYNSIVGNEKRARVVAEAIASVDPQLFWVTLAGFQAEMIRNICREVGIRPMFEAFPDRAYTADGHLLSRRLPGAVIHDPDLAAERAVRMVAEQRVIAADGTSVPLEAQTLCVHGDEQSAVDLIKKIRTEMAAAGIEVVPMGEMGSSRNGRE